MFASSYLSKKRNEGRDNYGPTRGLGSGGRGILFEAEKSIVKGIASGIGLASEAIHRQREKNALKKASQSGEQESSGPEQLRQQDAYLRVDEAAWQIDEAQEEAMREDSSFAPLSHLPPYPPPSYSSSEDQLTYLADSFLQNHTVSSVSQSNQSVTTTLIPTGLTLPVVITQRRPGKRSRGFVRAYAPVLQDAAGIDESTFLEFLDDLNKATEPSPYIQAVNLAGLACVHVPEPTTILVSLALTAITNVADEVHSRFKTNKFLDRMNKEFFVPRGLVALIATWKPSATNELVTAVDFDGGVVEPVVSGAVAASSGEAKPSKLRNLKHTFASSSGASAFEFPETAPLVFPVLDSLAIRGNGNGDNNDSNNTVSKRPNTFKRAGSFVKEYMDKRARAEWAGQNPDSKMANAGPKEVFHSRYADPNHPASSGDPIALLTGGYLQHPLYYGRASSGKGRGGSSSLSANRPSFGGIGVLPNGISSVKKMFEKDILYLMIVPLPSEQQMAMAPNFVSTLNEMPA
ncbi:hypothetical protein F5Y16DRAFT_397531 [Xylariaceae sp. FL0255]|nr:hypothetical protein F5Y16DRAFT_397531 [Xylariaceae sp. FL0255]